MSEQSITTPDEGPLTRHSVLFYGKAGEFFSIWIVNIALSILTLGIYSAWAKVRTNRYFYGNTELAGHRFDYTADPVQILKGRILAFVVLIVLSNLNLFDPLLGIVGTFALMALLPFAMVLSLRFTAARTMYRNVSFRFVGSYGQAALVILVVPSIAFVSLGLLAPLATKMAREFIYANMRYGDREIALNLPVGALYKVLGKALLYSVLIAIPVFILAPLLLIPLVGPEASMFVWFFGGYLIVIVAMGYYSTGVLNLCFNYGVLDGKHRFQSVMNPWKVLEIRITNALAIIASLGMLYPWARVRFMNYRASCTAVLAADDVDAYTDDVDASVTATGEGVGDFIDLDIGF